MEEEKKVEEVVSEDNSKNESQEFKVSEQIEEGILGEAKESSSNGNDEKKVVVDVKKLNAFISSFKKEIEDRDKKINELKDISVRLAADFENYRKRVQKEKVEYTKFANKDLILDILPIMDNFDRAIETIERANLDGTAKEIFTGVKLIYKELESVLLKHGVEKFNTEGKVFDPNINEVIEFSEVEIDEGEEGDFVDKEFLKPYKMHDQVIRHGKVKVVRKKKKDVKSDSENESGST